MIYWGENLVAFFSTIPIPSGNIKNSWRAHRIVVLPDYQGLGIGTKLLDFFGKKYIEEGKRFFLRSTHLRYAGHCRRSSLWSEGASSGKKNPPLMQEQRDNGVQASERTPFSFEYVGERYCLPHQRIVCLGDVSIDVARKAIERIAKKDNYVQIVSGNALKELNVWEQVALEKKYATEILFSHSKETDEFNIVETKLKKKYDLIVFGQDEQKIISKYTSCAKHNTVITKNYKTNRYFVKIDGRVIES